MLPFGRELGSGAGYQVPVTRYLFLKILHQNTNSFVHVVTECYYT